MSGHFNAETQRARRAAEAGRATGLCFFSAFLGGLCVSALRSLVGAGFGRSPGPGRTPNNWVQATPGYACVSFLSRWPGAPDPERWDT